MLHRDATAGIAIVGGGVGGLTLTRVLQRNGLDAVVYEREPSRESRAQVCPCGSRKA